MSAEEMSAEEMSAEEKTPDLEWTMAEENLLVVARELEWAEAYAADHPECRMGRLYLDFLHWEMVSVQAGV